MPKIIKQDGKSIRLLVTDSDDQTIGRTTDFFHLTLAPHSVVILHPSFGCPVIAEPGAKITLFIVADADCYRLRKPA